MAVHNRRTYNQDAVVQINALLDHIHQAYAMAGDLAAKHNIAFGYDGPAGHGDGGVYDPDGPKDHPELAGYVSDVTLKSLQNKGV